MDPDYDVEGAPIDDFQVHRRRSAVAAGFTGRDGRLVARIDLNPLPASLYQTEGHDSG